MTSPAAWGDSPETTWTDAAGNRRLYDPDLDDNYPGTSNDREREEYPSEAQKWPQEGEQPQTHGSGRAGRFRTSEAPTDPHLVKTSLWGKKTFHDPRTGKELKKANPKAEKLKKPGWF